MPKILEPSSEGLILKNAVASKMYTVHTPVHEMKDNVWNQGNKYGLCYISNKYLGGINQNRKQCINNINQNLCMVYITINNMYYLLLHNYVKIIQK